MKIRVSFDVDVTNELTYGGRPEPDGSYTRVPIDATNALDWYRDAFDAYESNYEPGFVTNMKAEVIPNT